MSESTINSAKSNHIKFWILAVMIIAITTAWWLHDSSRRDEISKLSVKLTDIENALRIEQARASGTLVKLKETQALLKETLPLLKETQTLLSAEKAKTYEYTCTIRDILTELEETRKRALVSESNKASLAVASSATAFGKGEEAYLVSGKSAAESDAKKWAAIAVNPNAYDLSMHPNEARDMSNLKRLYVGISDSYRKLKGQPADSSITPYDGAFDVDAIALAKRKVAEQPHSYQMRTPRFVSANVDGVATNKASDKIYIYHVWGEMDVPNSKGAYIRTKYSVLLCDSIYIDGRTGQKHEPSWKVTEKCAICASTWTDYLVIRE